MIFTDWFGLSWFPRYCPFSVKKTDLFNVLGFTLFLAGADSAPSLLPRGFRLSFLSCLTQGLKLSDFSAS